REVGQWTEPRVFGSRWKWLATEPLSMARSKRIRTAVLLETPLAPCSGAISTICGGLEQPASGTPQAPKTASAAPMVAGRRNPPVRQARSERIAVKLRSEVVGQAFEPGGVDEQDRDPGYLVDGAFQAGARPLGRGQDVLH